MGLAPGPAHERIEEEIGAAKHRGRPWTTSSSDMTSPSTATSLRFMGLLGLPETAGRGNGVRGACAQAK